MYTSRLDRNSLDSNVQWKTFATAADYAVANITVNTTGAHFLSHMTNARFSAILYGSTPSDCSYAMPAGLCLKEIVPPAGTGGLSCKLYYYH